MSNLLHLQLTGEIEYINVEKKLEYKTISHLLPRNKSWQDAGTL